MARFLSLHLKPTWVQKEFGSDGKMTERIHHASDWHWAKRDWRETLFGAQAWHCRGKLGTARAQSLNSLSLCWPSTSIPSSAPHRHQHSLQGSCNARHGHWRGACSASLTKWHCFPVLAKAPNMQQSTMYQHFLIFFFNVLPNIPKVANRNYLTSSPSKIKGKDSNTSSHKIFERNWFCSH